MSLSRGCLIVELEPNQWYAVVACDEHDYDFDGNYDLFGPAATEEAVCEIMQRQVANPGGYNTYTHENVSDFARKLIAEEQKRQSERSRDRIRLGFRTAGWF
jgi:hypothetical protein